VQPATEFRLRLEVGSNFHLSIFCRMEIWNIRVLSHTIVNGLVVSSIQNLSGKT